MAKLSKLEIVKGIKAMQEGRQAQMAYARKHMRTSLWLDQIIGIIDRSSDCFSDHPISQANLAKALDDHLNWITDQITINE